MSEPRGMHDMTGWLQVTCRQRENVFRDGADLLVASSLTDPDGNYGSPITFTEWWWRDVPILRDYLEGRREDGNRPCRHYLADGLNAALGISYYAHPRAAHLAAQRPTPAPTEES